MNNRGIIYFNTGRKCLTRLAVSIYSLRKYYTGNITLLYIGNIEPEYDIICNQFNCSLKKIIEESSEGKNKVFLDKILAHTNTPYNTSIFLDSDTIILKDPSEDLFSAANDHEFAICQLSNRETKGIIAKRINEWKDIYPQFIEKALNFGPAINGGVVAFRKDSKFIKDWYKYTIMGRKNFIPDEVCCQILLPQYSHIILDDRYNTSCKYSKIHEDTRVIHFHGRKHNRTDKDGNFLFHGDIWEKYFQEYKNKK